MATEFNFIHESNPESDETLFFGDGEEVSSFSDGSIMADIVVVTGKFPSKGQARKNGFDKPIPDGFSHHIIGKGKNRIDIWILNKVD